MQNLTIGFAEKHKIEMFPDALVVEAADSDLNTIIDSTDANNVLEYYAKQSIGVESPKVAEVGTEVCIIKNE
jgi:hypothetical protein